MKIDKTINDLENYNLVVQEAKQAAISLLAGLDGLFEEITQSESITKNDLLSLKEQYKIDRCQAALTKALTKL